MASGNRRKLLCLQRRIGIVHWKEVNWIVRGNNQSQLRLSHVVYMKRKKRVTVIWDHIKTRLPSWCTCYSWRFISCWVLESQMLQMDISEDLRLHRLHPLVFIHVVSMILLGWAQVCLKWLHSSGGKGEEHKCSGGVFVNPACEVEMLRWQRTHPSSPALVAWLVSQAKP